MAFRSFQVLPLSARWLYPRPSPERQYPPSGRLELPRRCRSRSESHLGVTAQAVVRSFCIGYRGLIGGPKCDTMDGMNYRDREWRGCCSGAPSLRVCLPARRSHEREDHVGHPEALEVAVRPMNARLELKLVRHAFIHAEVDQLEAAPCACSNASSSGGRSSASDSCRNRGVRNCASGGNPGITWVMKLLHSRSWSSHSVPRRAHQLNDVVRMLEQPGPVPTSGVAIFQLAGLDDPARGRS